MYPNIGEVHELNATERGSGGFGSTKGVTKYMLQ
jgi:dUTPase